MLSLERASSRNVLAAAAWPWLCFNVLSLSPRSAQNCKCFSYGGVLSHPTGKKPQVKCWDGGKLSAYGESIIIIFCPQAAWPHLVDAGTSTRFIVGIVSFSNLFYGITLIEGHLLTFQARGERILHHSSQGFCGSCL